MPVLSIVVLALIISVFVTFAVTLAYGDFKSRAGTRK